MNRIENQSSYKGGWDFINPHLIKLIIGQTSQQMGRPVCFPVYVGKPTFSKVNSSTTNASNCGTNISLRVTFRVIDEGDNMRTVTFKENILKSEVLGKMDRIVEGKGLR
jgi:hypothetical protein